MNRRLLLVAYSVLVASCGGGGSSEPGENVSSITSFSDGDGVLFKVDNDFVRIGPSYAFVGKPGEEAKISSSQKIETGTIVYMFDDGYVSHYEKVAPLFENYGIKAAFALVYNYIDRAQRVSKSQALDLQERGFEIVNHSMSHRSLTSDSESLSTAEYEIKTAKDNFENDGFKIRSFVAPYSNTNEKYIEFVEDNHYSAYTIYNGDPLQPALWDDANPTYRLHRLNTELAISSIEETIDLVVSESGFVTFYDHDIDGGRTSLEKVEEIILYGINSGATFNTPTEAARKHQINSLSYCDLNLSNDSYDCSVSSDLSFSSSIDETNLESLTDGVYGPVSIHSGSITFSLNECSYTGLISSSNNAYFSDVSGDCGSGRLYFVSSGSEFYHLFSNSDSFVYGAVEL